MAEECFREARLQGNQRAVIDIAPREVASARDVIELIAKVAPARVRLVQIGEQMEEEQGGREHGRETDGLLELLVHGERSGCGDGPACQQVTAIRVGWFHETEETVD